MRRVILAIVSTAAGLVLLLSFKTHPASSLTSAPSSAIASPTPGASNSTGTTSPSSSASPSSGSPSSATTTKTVTGDAVQTIYGPVEVQVTVKNGKLAAVNAVEYPQESPRDEQINAYAIPALNQEALAAGSAKIDTVSGATYTSGGYISSLQSALDKAGL